MEELFGKKAVPGSVSEMVEITPHHFRKSSGEWELALKNMPPICASRITYFSLTGIFRHSVIPGTSFRRRPESSVIYPSTRGWHLGSGESRSDEYIATGPIDAFDTGP